MESVYVLEPGAYLKREGESLKVMKEKQVIDRIPAANLKRLMLVGYITLSGPVLDFLIRKRVETVFVTPTGRFRARLLPDEHRHVALRRNQYLKLNDPDFALKTAAQMVYGKLMNFYFLLKRRGSDYQVQELKDTALRIRSMAAHALAVDNMDKLRGVEGLATRVYFSSFKHLIRQEEFFFNGRNRRPPKDPVNAMLSFVYTLLTNEVQSAVSICGLDPYFGALHEIDYGRPSLACDLVEEYRAFLGDRMVLGLINRKAVAAGDFIIRETKVKTYVDEQDMREKRPVEMKPAAARAFIASYEEMMKRQMYYPSLDKKVNYRWLIINQVRRFGESLEDGKGLYQPFLWRN